MILLKRISSGVSSHFTRRIVEWLMIFPCAGMGLALNLQPQMFRTSPSFSQLSLWFNEQEWAFLVLSCAIVRMSALTVNGTFDTFRYSPHLRIAASFLSGLFWSQFAAGFLVAAVTAGGAWSAVVAYSTFLMAEFVNMFMASRDLTRR